MGSFSVSIHRGLVHWQGLLLVVSLEKFWCLPAAVQPVIRSLVAEEGQNVHLRIRNLPCNITSITWYKGKGEDKNYIIAFLKNKLGMHVRGPADGHVTINADGSLLIKNVTQNDRGYYTVAIYLKNSKEGHGWGRLNVYERLGVPILVASNTTVTENKDVVELTCYTKGIFTQWLFNGTNMQPSERIKIHQGRKKLSIEPVRREDAGSYQCRVFNPVKSAESAPLELNVKHE